MWVNRVAVLACAATLGLSACSSATEPAEKPAPSATTTEVVLNEDDQFASYVDPLIEADAIDWTAEYTESFEGDEIATLSGHMVRGGGSAVTFTAPTGDGDVAYDYRILGGRVLLQPADLPAATENCWIDTTGHEPGLRGLPRELDPLAPLAGADVTRARLDEVAVALPGGAPTLAFPRWLVQRFPSPPKQARTEAVVSSTDEDAMSYRVDLFDFALTFPSGTLSEEQSRRFRSTVLTMTVTASDDTEPIEEPPAASILRPGQQPTKPCPASA